MFNLFAVAIVLLTQTIYIPLAILEGVATPSTVESTVIVLPNTATGYNHVFGYIIYGEVQNNTANHIALVRVFATRPNGEQQDAITQLGALAPGEKGCFAINTLSPTLWDDAVLSVTYHDNARPRPNNFATEEAQVGVDGQRPVVVGTIRNNNGQAVRAVHVVATLYDTNGKVIGCNGVSSTPRDIAAGGAGSFYNRFDLYVDRPVASYALGFSGVTP